MSQCVALARRTDRRCENDAAPGRLKCELHDAMGPHWQAVGHLKEDAYRLGHVAISRSQYDGLLQDRELLQEMKRNETRIRPVGWGS